MPIAKFKTFLVIVCLMVAGWIGLHWAYELGYEQGRQESQLAHCQTDCR